MPCSAIDRESLPYQAGSTRGSAGSALRFAGSVWSRAKAAAAARRTRFSLPAMPPAFFAAPIASATRRNLSEPAQKARLPMSSVTGNTCSRIPEVMRSTCWSYAGQAAGRRGADQLYDSGLLKNAE
jgi:hypothetical protein